MILQRPQPLSSRYTILVVDDEESVRVPTGLLLESLGCAVLYASDGEEALEIYRERHQEIHLVLLDMHMPRWNGLETLRRLSTISEDVKAILCSGDPEGIARERFGTTGFCEFLQKPYRITTLRQKIQVVLDDPAEREGDG